MLRIEKWTETLPNMSGLGEVFPFLSASLARPLGMGRKHCGKGKDLDSSGKMIRRWAGKAWCGLGEVQSTQLGCGSMQCLWTSFRTFSFVLRCCQNGYFRWWSLHSKAGLVVFPLPKGGWHGSPISHVFNSRWAGWSQQESREAPADLS